MEVLNIDTIGPVSKDSADNCYILVIIDCFTRFVELYPVSDTSALPCARALLSHVCRYGTPMTIRSDHGTQFVNGIISQLLSLLQIDHELSLAYSKEQNAIVERANKEVMRHLTAIIFDRRVSEVWSSEYLPLVQRIMNAKVHDIIGVSPAELVFGKAINLYAGLLLPIPPESLIKDTANVAEHRLSDHVARLIKVQSLLIEIARDNQLSADSFHIKESSPPTDMFPVKSYVLLKPPDGALEKLRMPKAGPYIVVGISGDKYSIQDRLTHKTTDTHVSNLCEFRYNSSSGLEPIEVAARNAGEFFIDKIYGHRGTTTKRLSMEFLVSWKGYSQKDDTWDRTRRFAKPKHS
jgi:hypothetical protein